MIIGVLKNFKKTIAIFSFAIIALGTIAATQAVSQRIITIGDSTVQDYTTGYAPRKGWGQLLQLFFSASDVLVINRAVGGTSSKSFYNSYWSNVKAEIKSGDFVFIQFGINDRAKDTLRAASGDVFKGYLKKYINETKALGGIPVLVSTLRRNAWNADGTPYDAYHEHPQLVRDVAAEMNVALVDLDTKAKAALQRVGQNYSTKFWYNNYVAGEYPNYVNGNVDDVHFQEMGALQMAKLIVEGIKDLKSNTSVSKLIPFIKPQYTLTIKSNNSVAGITTITETYPEGVNLHLKALANDGHTFKNWKKSDNTILATTNIKQITFTASNQTYTAFFDNDLIADCAGIYGGTAQIDGCGICSGGTTGKIACLQDCNGDWGGTAIFDSCANCILGKTTRKSCTESIQAESTCEIDGVKESTNTGYLGAGYANTNNVLGASLYFVINSPIAQSIDLQVRYSNGGATNRDAIIKLNEKVLSTMLLPTTNGWSIWKNNMLTIPLIAGRNTVIFEANSAGGLANIDLLSWSNTTVHAGPCVVTHIIEANDFDLLVSPNPFDGLTTINFDLPYSYNIVNSLGVTVESGNNNVNIGTSLLPGIYILIVNKNNISYCKAIVKI